MQDRYNPLELYPSTMRLLKAKRLINRLTKRRFVAAVLLVFLSGCTKVHRIPTVAHQVIQIRQANLGSNYVICKEGVDYIDPATLMQQEELTINNQEEEYEKL